MGEGSILSSCLSQQYDDLRRQLADYRRTGAAEALHRARIAIRRFRALLRLFRKPLRGTGAGMVSGELRTLLRILGKARDQDVHRESLQQIGKKLGIACGEPWRSFWDDWCRAGQGAHLQARSWLRDAPVRHLLRRAGSLCVADRRKEFREAAEFRGFVARRLSKSVRGLLRKKVRIGRLTPEEQHRFRRKCRLLRYWMEFAQPHLGRGGSPFLKSARKVTAALGEARDAQVLAASLPKRGLPWVPEIQKCLEQRQARALRKFSEAWKAWRRQRFMAQRFYRQVRASGP